MSFGKPPKLHADLRLRTPDYTMVGANAILPVLLAS